MTASQTETAPLTNTDRLVNATHALVQAERTGDVEAIQKAEARQSFYARQVAAEGARQRETARQEALGVEGRYDEEQTAAYSPTHL